MTRLRPVSAYWRKIPERPDAFAHVHLELGRAYLLEKERRASEEHDLAEELERKLSDEDAW